MHLCTGAMVTKRGAKMQLKKARIALISAFILTGFFGMYLYQQAELRNMVNRYINEISGLEVVLENFYNLLESNKEKAEVPKTEVLCIMVQAHRNLEIVQSRYVNSSLSTHDTSSILLKTHEERMEKIKKYISPYNNASEYYENMCVPEN